MNMRLIAYSTSLIILIACGPTQKAPDLVYPTTKKVDQSDDYFGTTVDDPYRWLEDDRSEETGEWVKTQNQLTQSYLGQIDFKDKIAERLNELYNYEKIGAPFKEGDHYYYYRNDGLQNQYVLYQTKDPSKIGTVLIDPNKLSDDGTVALTNISFSGDGKYGAYAVSSSGSDWREIYVIDTETKEKLRDKLEWVKFTTIAWRGNGFYYQRFDKPAEGDELKGQIQFGKLFYHELGTDQSADVLIYENPDNPNNRFNAWVSEDERYLVIYSTQSTSGNELYIQDMSEGDSRIKPIITGFEKEHRMVSTDGDRLYIETNLNAPNNRLVQTTINNPGPDTWKDVIPETKDVLTASVGGDKFFASYLIDARAAIKQFDRRGNFERDIVLRGIGTVPSFGANRDDIEIYYSFTSFTYPSRIYKYDITSGESDLFRSPDLKFDPEDFETKQIFYSSKDGTQVPMFIVYKRGLELNGKNPTWLYSYGGFNISLTPTFSTSRIVWLENGGVFAQPNIRGGGEYGEEWHKAGTKLQKKNVFEDYIAAAEYLIENKYTSPDFLALEGGSNGGLLVGATMNMRPDLAKVAFPRVGVMDMLRYQHFTIGRAWSADYGTSEDSKEMFDYLHSYSPLHNISGNANYPATMVMTADHDDRVVPAHSFKYGATLQEKYAGDRPILIRIETSAGHGAGTPTTKLIEQRADTYAFAWYNMGIIPEMVKKSM